MSEERISDERLSELIASYSAVAPKLLALSALRELQSLRKEQQQWNHVSTEEVMGVFRRSGVRSLRELARRLESASRGSGLEGDK